MAETVDTDVNRMETINEIAEYFVNKNDGNPSSAAQEMADFIRRPENSDMFYQIMGPMAVNACYHHVRSVYQRRRQVLWGTTNNATSSAQERVASLARSNAQSLLEFTLPITGMPKLGDSGIEEIQRAIEYYETHATNFLTKARWLDKIANTIDPGQAVRQQLDDESLFQMKQEAESDQ